MPGSSIALLLVSGSLRGGSTNAAVLRTAAALAPEGVDAALYGGMGDLPHFTPDDDVEGEPVHAAVAAMRAAVARADALLLCTPEYAGALPGALKNLLEWTVGDAGTHAKPIAWINAAGPAAPTGAADAHESLRKVLGYVGADVVDAACRRVPITRGDVGADGLIARADARAAIAASVAALVAHVRLRADGAEPAGVRAAPDLTGDGPRPFGLDIDGYAHLPRMLDKARATLAGTAGGYRFGCPVDHTCMARLGVTPELVLDLAARHADDESVLAALRDHGIPPAEEAWFDAVAVEDELQEEDVYLRVRHRDELPESAAGRRFAGADHGADVDVVLVEVAPGEGGGAPAGTAAQVWAIQAGQARLFLGARQARIVRAGEVVRIPAGVPWRFENTGATPLRAVAAGAAGPG